MVRQSPWGLCLTLCLASSVVVCRAERTEPIARDSVTESTEPVAEFDDSSTLFPVPQHFTARWKARAATMVVYRARYDNYPMVTESANGRGLLYSDDFDQGWFAGPELEIERTLEPRKRVFLRHFNLWDLASGDSGFSAADRRARLFQAPSTSPITNLGSQIYSTEINYQAPLWRGIDWNAGARWVRIRDELDAYFDDSFGSPLYLGIDTTNDLVGGQLGLAGPIFDRGGRLRIDWSAKLGLMGNITQASGTFAGPQINQIVETSRSDSSSFFSLLVEYGLFARYRLTNHIECFSGFYMLLIDNTVEAALQPRIFNSPSSPIFADSTELLGLNTGVDVRW